MKTLYINRHAKSDWNSDTVDDFNRPLNPQGEHDAFRMAEIFVSRAKKVDLIVSSPAKRALSTAHFFAKAMGIDRDKIVPESNIYEAKTQDLLQIINDIDDGLDTVLLFGHNPGLALLVQYLTGEYVNMATCAIAGIELHINNWKAVSEDTGSLFVYDYPKNHFQP